MTLAAAGTPITPTVTGLTFPLTPSAVHDSGGDHFIIVEVISTTAADYATALSSSNGNYAIAHVGQSAMVSGSNTVWPAGSLMKCLFTTAAGAIGGSAQKGITVQVYWSPSGSFPNRTAAP